MYNLGKPQIAMTMKNELFYSNIRFKVISRSRSSVGQGLQQNEKALSKSFHM